MSQSTISLAVIGAGIMGANHVRVAGRLSEVDVCAVVDPEIEKAGPLAASVGARVASSIDGLRADAAIVAVPTRGHLDIALALIERGIHLLVEKPLALNPDDARRINDAAEAAGVVLAVGHIERFNPVVIDMARWIDAPIHIEASRISPYTSRISDGVIFDLMIHDLDIVQSFVGVDDDVLRVEGVARSVHGTTEDLASVTVAFASGVTATFNTSRLGQEKIRRIEVTQVDSAVVADLMRQDLTITRMSHHEYLSDDGARYRQSSVVEIPFVETRGEPLALELAHFVDCVRTGSQPRVGGRDGVRAVELASRAEAAVFRSGGHSTGEQLS